MGTIQSGVGLISGVDIAGTVDKLMAISSKSRDMLQESTDKVTEQQTAVTTLSALLYSVKYLTDNLGKAEVFQQRAATSSAPTVLSAALSGNPALGTYEYTPLRTVQNQKFLSSGVRTDSQTLGAGTMTIRFGDPIDRATSLNATNSGDGFVRGKMRIVDRSGATADIDLSTAQSLDEILDAINTNSTVNVTASAVAGHIRVSDNTGGAGTLKVLDIGSGKTAASLGLASISANADSADGLEIFRLNGDMDLSILNDGQGVAVNQTLPDFKYTLRDGTIGEIDLAPHDNTQQTGDKEVTLQEVIDRIASQSNGKLSLEIGADGNHLQLVDKTAGAGEFAVESLYDSQTLTDLGLTSAVSDGTITGRRVLGGLKSPLLASLNGGNGVGTLGVLSIQNRAGVATDVDLSSAETLDDVIQSINASAAQVRAGINAARNGIELVDISGGTSGPLAISDGDAENTATKLGIARSSDAGTVGSGDMHLKVVGMNTTLSSLNGGAGVARNTFEIIDSRGVKATVDLRSTSIQTVGDAIRAINRLQLTAQASLNDTGDGIILRDTGSGSGVLTVRESGSGTTAKDLGLLRGRTNTVIGGQSVQTIDGSSTTTIEIGETDTLSTLNSKINALNAGFSSSIVVDGSSRPYRLALTSGRGGAAGSMVVDMSVAPLSMTETAKGQDALLLMGSMATAATGALMSSSTNSYKNLVDGLSLEIKQATGTTVSVQVSSTDVNLTANVQTLVDNYNKFRDKLAEYTKYDETTGTGSTLTGDGTALRFDIDLTQLLSSRFLGVGKYQTFTELGIQFSQDGKLQFDKTKLQAAFADDPASVQDFFSTADKGAAGKFSALIEQLAGADNSLVSNRLEALDSKVAANKKRIEAMNTHLDLERERMLTSFYNMELAIGKLQNSSKALDSIQWILNYNPTSNSSSNN